MKAFLRKILSYLLMLGKVWSRAKPPPAPAADISQEMLETLETLETLEPITKDIPEAPGEPATAAPGWSARERVLSRHYQNRPVPDGKWVMRHHRGRH